MTIEAMKQALEKIANVNAMDYEYQRWAREALAIAEAEKQEPVAWRVRWPKIGGGYAWVMNDAPLMEDHGFVNEPLYTSPPQRQPLTDEHPLMTFAKECVLGAYQESELADAAQRAIKAAHGIKEKNT